MTLHKSHGATRSCYFFVRRVCIRTWTAFLFWILSLGEEFEEYDY